MSKDIVRGSVPVESEWDLREFDDFTKFVVRKPSIRMFACHGPACQAQYGPAAFAFRTWGITAV
jgi:hypothetical protein